MTWLYSNGASFLQKISTNINKILLNVKVL